MKRIAISGPGSQLLPKIFIDDIIEFGEDFLCTYIIEDGGISYVYSASINSEKFCFIKQIRDGDLYQTEIISDKEGQQVALDLFHENYEGVL